MASNREPNNWQARIETARASPDRESRLGRKIRDKAFGGRYANVCRRCTRDTILGLPTPSWFLKMVSRAGASSIQRLTYFLKVSRFVLAGWRFDVDVMRQVSTRASIRA